MASPRIKKILTSDGVRYEWVVAVGVHPVTGKPKQVRRRFIRRGDAQTELAKVLHEVNRGSYTAASAITVGDYLDDWLRSVTRGKEAATARNYSDALKPVYAVFGRKPLQKLTTADVEDLVEWMLTAGRRRGGKVGTPLSPRTVQLTLSRLRSALADAVNRELVERNVAAAVRCPVQVKTVRQPWTQVEVRQFLASLASQRLHAIMLLSLLGLRPAEVCGLRWSDVDLDTGTVSVETTRTLVATDAGMVVVEKGPKSASGRRVLPLPTVVVVALKALRSVQVAEQLAGGSSYCASGYVLVDEWGAPRRTDWLRRATYKAMAMAGVRKVRPYDARHACLTYLAMNGVPAVVVSAWAGHSDLSMAQRVYVHPSAKDLEAGRDALSTWLS